MNNRRTVNKLSSIIDLLNHESARLIGKPAIRIRYEYDGINGNQEFIVLNEDIPKESADNIISWLKDNVTSDDIIYGLKSNEIDAENFGYQKKAA